MAEYVRRRYRTARFATTVALLGVLAGIGLGQGDESVLDFEDAAARGQVITLQGNSITSKHIKNGSLLTKDFKKGELERKWDKIVLKHGYLTDDNLVERFGVSIEKWKPILTRALDATFVGESELDQKSSDIFLKLDSAFRKHADTAFVGEGEFESRSVDMFLKLDSALRKHQDDAFIGENELDAKSVIWWQKVESATRKHLDSNYVRDDELSSDMGAALSKFDSSPRKVLDRIYMKVELSRQTLAMPPVGTSSSVFDVSTVPVTTANGGPQECPTIAEVTGFLKVCAKPSLTSMWTVKLFNTFDTDLFYSYTPAAKDTVSGGTLPVGESIEITTPAFSTRTIQIAPISGEDVPLATLTVSGSRGAGDGPARISTNMTIARP